MFARVFDTARRILSRSPSVQAEIDGPSQEIPRSTQGDATDMVTTRRGTGTAPASESTPRSSARRTKGKRELETESQDTPTATKRRRKVESIEESTKEQDDSEALQTDDGNNDEGVSNAVTIPHRTKESSEAPVAGPDTPARRSPRVVVSTPNTSERTAAQATKQEPAKSTPAKESAKGRRRSKRLEAVVDEADEVPSSTWESDQSLRSPVANAATKTTGFLETSKDDGDEDSGETEIESQEPKEEATATVTVTKEGPSTLIAQAVESTTIPASTTEVKKTHKRFGSEEPAEDIPALQKDEPADEDVDEDDGASDSDEAPEMVTTSAAASKAKASSNQASRARDAQQAQKEKQRQQRADRIAAEQAEKRKRETKAAQKLAKREAKNARLQERDAASPSEDLMDIDMRHVPDLLPESILEAAGDQRPPTPPPVRAGKTKEDLMREKMNRHIKFLEQGEKPIKDVKKGKVNVSVLAKQNMLLAPKVNRDTKNVREHWLKGREADRKHKGSKKKGMPLKKMERRPMGGGFLRGGDE